MFNKLNHKILLKKIMFLDFKISVVKEFGSYLPPWMLESFSWMSWSSHRRCSMWKGVLRNFTKFTGKQLFQGLFLSKVAGQVCKFIKKETLAQVFSCEFCEIFKNTFFTEHVWTTASRCRTIFLVRCVGA